GSDDLRGGPMRIQEQSRDGGPVGPWSDAWSGWAPVYEVPASIEYGLVATEDGPPAAEEPEPLGAAVGELRACLADERERRATAEADRRRAEDEAQAGRLETARLTAELAAERGRVAQLERERD